MNADLHKIPESPEVAREREARAAFDRIDEKFGPRYFNMDGQPISMWDWSMGYQLKVSRHVGDTYLRIRGHVYRVSTVLLGLDHSFSPWPHKPVIFETMVFQDGNMSGDIDGLGGICERYCTKEEAAAGHRRIVRYVRRTMAALPRPKQLISHGGKP